MSNKTGIQILAEQVEAREKSKAPKIIDIDLKNIPSPKDLPKNPLMGIKFIEAVRYASLTNGYTIKEGEQDLKGYVYNAAFELAVANSANVSPSFESVINSISPNGMTFYKMASGSVFICNTDIEAYREILRKRIEALATGCAGDMDRLNTSKKLKFILCILAETYPTRAIVTCDEDIIVFMYFCEVASVLYSYPNLTLTQAMYYVSNN